LETLVTAWLRDLDYQWKTKSSTVPGADALAEIGLLSQLKDSTIRYEVPIRGNPALCKTDVSDKIERPFILIGRS